MSTNELQTLSDKIDARLALVEQLKSGLDAGTDLVNKLTEANSSLDSKISGLLQQAADTSKLDTVTQQVTDKNTQLQGLVNKVSSVLK
jgi:type II secretory pathway component PulF